MMNKIKKILSVLICVSIVFTCLSAVTAGAEEDGGVYVIPDGVTAIAEEEFRGAKYTSIVIPDSVTSIGDHAFWGCNNLKSITIPGSVASIGKEIFWGCESLESVVISEGVKATGYHMFWGCESLTSVTLPESITSIAESTFDGCEALESVTIPDGVVSIGALAFYGCGKLTSITIPASVCVIGEGAFRPLTNFEVDENNKVYSSADNVLFNKNKTRLISYCANGEEYTVPDSVSSIADRAFYGNQSIKKVTIPDNVTTIGAEAFFTCYNLESVNIPVGVEKIENYTFFGTGITSITIPDGVTSIGKGAFSGCDNLTSVTIPVKVSDIGTNAFNGAKLERIDVDERNPYYMSLDGVLFARSGSLDDNDAYSALIEEAGWLWEDWCYEIGANMTNVAMMLECLYEDLDDTEAMDLIMNTEYGAITMKEACVATVIYTLGESLGNDAAALIQYPAGKAQTEYVIPDNVWYIAGSAFSGCDNLTSVTIPDSVSLIGYSAFSSCTNLDNIAIGEGMLYIGSWAFYDCDMLTDVYYGGDRSSWDSMVVISSSWNETLDAAKIHFNWE